MLPPPLPPSLLFWWGAPPLLSRGWLRRELYQYVRTRQNTSQAACHRVRPRRAHTHGTLSPVTSRHTHFACFLVAQDMKPKRFSTDRQNQNQTRIKPVVCAAGVQHPSRSASASFPRYVRCRCHMSSVRTGRYGALVDHLGAEGHAAVFNRVCGECEGRPQT